MNSGHIAELVFLCNTPRAVLFFFVHVASFVASKAASGCVAAIGQVSKLYVGGDVIGTTISP